MKSTHLILLLMLLVLVISCKDKVDEEALAKEYAQLRADALVQDDGVKIGDTRYFNVTVTKGFFNSSRLNMHEGEQVVLVVTSMDTGVYGFYQEELKINEVVTHEPTYIRFEAPSNGVYVWRNNMLATDDESLRGTMMVSKR